jgi:regulator of protease activity HflC (stomatin/prohibitin superfamily)
MLHQVDGGGGGGGAAESRRTSSMSFRADGAPGSTPDTQDAAAMLDPANQSLAEALNILLKLLYLGVTLLFIAYLVSGFKFVNEGQRGIRLLFGKVQDSNLEPGFRWGPPFPFGDIVTVAQGVNSVAIDKSFWVFDGGSIRKDLDSLSPTSSLKPDQGGSGSIITGDGNLVHARWSAQYRRSNAKSFAENILTDREDELVQAAIRRGVVRACAQVSIDQMLRTSAENQGAIALRAREVAQGVLDAANSGITIETLSLTEVTPPLMVRPEFAKTQSATANAEKAKENASSERTSVLNGAAGDVAGYLIAKIDAYELALGKQDAKAAAGVLEEIDAVLAGGSVEIEGVERRASGQVTRLIGDARAYRDRVVTQAISDFNRFEALLAQYRVNPSVMVQQEWSSAVATFYERKSVMKMFLPAGDDGDLVQIMLNRDPYAMRDQDRAVKEAEARRAARLRQEENRKSQFETNTPTTVSE